MCNTKRRGRGRPRKGLPPTALSLIHPVLGLIPDNTKHIRGVGDAAIEEYLSPNEVAAAFGVTSTCVSHWIIRHLLPAKKLPNGYWIIKRTDLDRFLYAPQSPKNKQILILDDDMKFLTTAKTVLEACQFVVYFSVNGADAMLKMREHPMSLLVINLLMDNGAGWAIAEQVSRFDSYKRVPMLFVGKDGIETNEMDRLIKIGGKGFLGKPVTVDQIRFAVEQALASTANHETDNNAVG